MNCKCLCCYREQTVGVAREVYNKESCIDDIDKIDDDGGSYDE